MQKQFLLSFFFLGFGIFSLQAQEHLIKGAIVSQGYKQRIALTEVENRRTKVKTESNNFGLFSIRALMGDTLMFSKLGFESKPMVVHNTADMLISLMPMSHSLEEVQIFGESKKKQFEDIQQDFKNKGSFYQGKPPLLSYIFKPLTAIYELFGRTPKQARRFNRYATNELQQSEIDKYFNDTIVKSNTQLEGKELEQFMIDYRPSYEMAEHWNLYDYLKYIKSSEKKFKEGLKP